MLRIIHCADIHLDSPFNMEDVQKANARRNELRSAFSSLMLLAKTEKADIVLIAGDLFDRRYVTADTVELVMNSFRASPNCKFIISPGNHDFYSPDSIYERKEFPQNVYIFKDESLKCFTFDDLRGYTVNVYGYAFCSPIMEKNPFSNVRITPSNEINILLAHGNMLSAVLPECPITMADIKLTGFDYIALGHIHNSPEIIQAGNTWYGYSGSLEPRSFNDKGARGAFFVSLDKENGVLTCKPEFVRLAKRIYSVEKINLTGISDENDIVDLTRLAIENKKYGNDTMLRIVFEGDIPPDVSIPKDKISGICSGLYYFEINDATSPAYNSEFLEKDATIKGALWRELSPMLESENENDRKIAKQALRYGLSALNGSEIIDW